MVLQNILQILWELNTFFVNVFLNFSVKCYTRIIEYRNTLEKDCFSELRYIVYTEVISASNLHS